MRVITWDTFIQSRIANGFGFIGAMTAVEAFHAGVRLDIAYAFAAVAVCFAVDAHVIRGVAYAFAAVAVGAAAGADVICEITDACIAVLAAQAFDTLVCSGVAYADFT